MEVRLGPVRDKPQTADEHGFGFWAQGGQACHRVFGVATYLVDEGRHITVDVDEGADASLVRLSLLGAALALALHQRGLLILHASAVRMNGYGVAFAGLNGAGKSTTAALLVERGHELIADDVVAIDLNDARPRMRPAFPRLKLWPDTLAQLERPVEDLDRVHPDYEKRSLLVGDRCSRESVELERLYMLTIGSSLESRELEPFEKFEAVNFSWYGNRFGSGAFGLLEPRHHFRKTTRLARRLVISELQRPDSLFDDPTFGDQLERLIFSDLGQR